MVVTLDDPWGTFMPLRVSLQEEGKGPSAQEAIWQMLGCSQGRDMAQLACGGQGQ